MFDPQPSVFAPPPATALEALVAHPITRALAPLPFLGAGIAILARVFRGTWRAIDEEALAERKKAGDEVDLRPVVALVLCAVTLSLQEYWGGRYSYDEYLRPWLVARVAPGSRAALYLDLGVYAWWALCRVLGDCALPIVTWKVVFPRDSILDLGLRVRSSGEHLRLYGIAVAIVLPCLLVASRMPDFGAYYPFYPQAKRSVLDLLLWELCYFAQFFSLELLFRGVLLGALRRSMGHAAIFVMAVPYCMIHYGKPYLEVLGAILAAIVLGSLAMRTRSIYAGFLVHVTVALSMDLLALQHRHAVPTAFFPP